MVATANATPDDYLKALYRKMSFHVLRLALVLSIIVDTTESANPENEVPESVMLYAVELCRYFIETGKKMYTPPPPPNLTSGHLYRMLHQTIGIKNITKFAEGLGISQQTVSKALSVLKT